MRTRVGLYNENFKMSEPEIKDVKEVQVRGNTSRFNISAGPLVFQDSPLKDTYVLEIDFSASEEVQRRMLGEVFTFGQHLYADYAEASHDLASTFCEEKGFTINNHLNSWPVFQAVVSRTPN